MTHGKRRLFIQHYVSNLNIEKSVRHTALATHVEGCEDVDESN